MPTFDGSSLEEWADSLGAGSQVDAEIAEALGEVEQRNFAKSGGRQVPLPPKRMFGEVRGDQLWAWTEVDGRIYDQPHIASAAEAAALQRGIKIPQAGFQHVGEVQTEEAPKTLWGRVPSWVKWTGGVAGVIGVTLLAEHIAIPKVLDMLNKGEEGEEEEPDEDEDEAPRQLRGASQQEIDTMIRLARASRDHRLNEPDDDEEEDESEDED